jgi:hypothetical protein
MKPYKYILSALKIGKAEKVSHNGTQPAQGLEESSDLARVTILFDLIRDLIADQQKQIDALDTKASVILGAATVLAGAAAALFPGLVSTHAEILVDPHIRWLLPALIVVYVLLVFFSCLAYAVRRYKRVPDPQALYGYRDKSEYFIKARVFTAMATALKENETRIGRKVRWVNCAIVGLGIETLILAAILFFQVLW